MAGTKDVFKELAGLLRQRIKPSGSKSFEFEANGIKHSVDKSSFFQLKKARPMCRVAFVDGGSACLHPLLHLLPDLSG